MDKLIYLSPFDIGNINGLSLLRNSGTFANYVDPIDFHFALFSTLYQSGANYFMTDENKLPKSIKENAFWKDKLVPFDKIVFDKSVNKTTKLLSNKLHFEEDSAKTRMLQSETVAILSNLFYTLQTGTPFVNTNSSFEKHLHFMEKRMDKELYNSLKLLTSLIVCENIQTITPRYSFIRDDIKRFEDIANSILFRNYSDSLQELQHLSKFARIKKNISVNSLKLFNKYGNNVNLKKTTYSFLKFNQGIVDTFLSKIPTLVGDFFLESFESLLNDKRRVSFYEIEEVKYHTLFCNIFDDTIKKEGYEKFKDIIEELKNEK